MLSYSAPRRITRNGKRTRFYYCRYYDPATRTQQWITTRCDTLKDAKVWRARKLREEADPDLAGKMRNRDRTMIAAAEEWLASKKGNVTEPHYQQIESKVQRLWTPFFRKRRLIDVQATDIEEFMQQRRAGKLRPRATRGRPARSGRRLQAATVNFDLDVLRTFFVWCLEKKRWINISPAKSASKVTGERVRGKIRSLTPEQEAALLEACRFEETKTVKAARNRGGSGKPKKSSKKSTFEQTFAAPPYLFPFVYVAMNAGFRRRTMMSLCWEHVDFENRRWRIPGSLFKVPENYDMPLLGDVDQVLKQYMATLPAERREPGAPIFGVSPSSNFRKSFTAAAKRAGLKGLGLHDLRRHFLNKLRSAGIPLDLAMNYTAHKDISTVMTYYREASTEQLDEAARQFDANERRRGRAVP